MKKIVKLTENDLTRIVKRVINENDRVYGYDNIKSLEKNLKDDEYIEMLEQEVKKFLAELDAKIFKLKERLNHAQ